MIIPYRVKNPPRTFPVATVALIGLNVLVFAATSQAFLVARRSMVDAYALRWGVTAPLTIVTAMFLHADIFHLLGNMLFLWIFGPAVEDRLRPWGYVGLYLLTGFAGTVAHATIGSVASSRIPTLGASGCIMGVLGAYWYLFPWSKVCLAYFFMYFIKVWYGVMEVAAVWVIGAYFLMDLFNGCLYKAAQVGGGVANFAHVGGALTGAILVWSLQIKRDSEQVSRAQATRAEVKDISTLSVLELKELLVANLEDESVLVTYVNKAVEYGTAEDIKFALLTNRQVVVTNCTRAVVHYLTQMNGPPDPLTASDLLYLARWCEQRGTPQQTLRMCELVQTLHPNAPELEMSLLIVATIQWHRRHDARLALLALDELLCRFPNGTTMFEAEDMRDEILGDSNKRAA